MHDRYCDGKHCTIGLYAIVSYQKVGKWKKCVIHTNATNNTPFRQRLRPFCHPCTTAKPIKSQLKAHKMPKRCLGRSSVVHRTFRPHHGRREVLSMLKTVTQRSLRRSVVHRWPKWGKRKACASPRSQNGCTVVGHWSACKNAYCCKHCVSIWAMPLLPLYHYCASLARPMAFIEPSLWRPLCLHSATTATLAPPWQRFCLRSASCCVTTVV